MDSGQGSQGQWKWGRSPFRENHPKSKHLWVDRTLNPDAKYNSVVDVFDTNTLELKKSIPAPEGVDGRAVHFEYNKAEMRFGCHTLWGKRVPLLFIMTKPWRSKK